MPVHLDPSNGGNFFAILFAGQKIPEIDSAVAYAHAAEWVRASSRLAGLDEVVNGLAAFVEAGVGGATGRAFRAFARDLGGVVPKLAGVADGQANGLHQLALQVEHCEYSIVIELAFFSQALV